MQRLSEKIGTKGFFEGASQSRDEMRGFVTDLLMLMDNLNPEVEDLPPEKVIRDFNMYLLSGTYHEKCHTRIRTCRITSS